ncbi:hypothetical protein ACUOA8_47130, partial [Escherichia sp. SS-MK2]
MIGFMSDQMLETAPRLTRAVSDEVLAVLLLSGTRYTPVDETVLELDSFPIKLGFEEVGFDPLLHLKLFPSFSLFILCNVSRRVASLDTAPGVEHLAKSFGR